MLRATIRGLVAHKLRVLLTALSVVLGVAFVAGTLVLSDTITGTFDETIADVNEGIDVSVTGVGPVADAGGPPLPEAVVAEVAAVDGVAAAVGTVEGYAQVVASDGDPIGGSLGTIGLSWNPDPAR